MPVSPALKASYSSSCQDDDLDSQCSAGRARIYGLEALASLEPRAGPLRLPLSAAYTLTRSEFRETFTSADPIYGSVEQGDQLPYVPRHQMNATFGVEHELAGAALAVTYVSRMREQAGSGALSAALATERQLWLDLSAYVRPLRWLALYGNLRNLTDSAYIVGRRRFGARPNAPCWLQLGLKLNY